MDKTIFEGLIKNPESEILDFKKEMYDIWGNKPKQEKEHKQSEFIKDIISFANTIRNNSGYIIVGIHENDGVKEQVGITSHYDDATFQEIIKDKVRPIPKFLYSEYKFEENNYGVFEIKIEKFELPCKPIKKFGHLEKNTIYIRRGSSNQEATSDEETKLQKWLSSLPTESSIVENHSNQNSEKINNYLKTILNDPIYIKSKQIYVELLGNANVFESEILGVHQNALSLFDSFTQHSETKIKKEQSVFDFIKENNKCVIIGGPGIGKSTTLNTYLFQQAQIATQNNLAQIPILIQSKEISDNNTIADIINYKVDEKSAVKLIENGKLMFLIDGLNEIPYEFQRNTRIELKKLMNKFSNNSYVFSERKFGFENIFNLPVFEIREFRDNQIENLIKKYANNFADNLIKQLKNRPQLYSLAKTPFLLTMILVIAQKENYKIPTKKGLLFQQFIETLLLWENKKRNRISISVKKDVLSYTSYQYNSNNVVSVPISKFKQFTKEALDGGKERITVNEIYEELLINYFIQKNDTDDLSFYHETYQEYFTALEIKHFFEKYNEFPIDIVESTWIEPFTLCNDLSTSERTKKSINAIIADSINSHVDNPETYHNLIPFIERFAINDKYIFGKTNHNIKKYIPNDYLTDIIKNKLKIPIKHSKSNLCRILQKNALANDIRSFSVQDVETNEKFEVDKETIYYNNEIYENSIFYYNVLADNSVELQPTVIIVASDFSSQQNTIIRFFKYNDIDLSPLPQTPISKSNYELLNKEFNIWYKKLEKGKYQIKQYNIELVRNCISNNLDKVKELIKNGASPNYSNVRGLTPLMLSVRKRNINVVEYLISLPNIELNQRSKDGRGMTAFMYAAQSGNIKIVKLFIKRGINVNEGSNGLNRGNKALLIASWEGNLDVIEILLENGAEINQTDSHGYTALIKACIKGKYDVTKFLLQKGADIAIRDNKGKSALQHCKNQGMENLLKPYLK